MALYTLRTFHVPAAIASLVILAIASSFLPADTLNLPAQSRVQSDSGEWTLRENTLNWDTHKTAIVVCDMWDKHWCQGATARVAEMAPRMNDLLNKARAKGVFIIHCPSGTLDSYKDHPARKRALAAPKIKTTIPLKSWCHLDPKKESPLPIDDSDGGCDSHPPCKQGRAWSRQIATLEIHDEDAITDSAEALYLMRQRGINNVMVMGVHTNMCVLGRPFSIRQMCNQGQNVVLVRDLTDAMYNPLAAPYVNHFRGTGLVVEHIEQHWCPTITSDAILGGTPHRFKNDNPLKVAVMIGEKEYKTRETLPPFIKNLVAWRGMETVIVHADPDNKHDFPAFAEAMNDADLLLVSVRRRALSAANLALIKKHLAAGKPIVGIRTSSHAFAPKGKDIELGASWMEFDADVLGGNYTGHHGKTERTTVSLPVGQATHPILTGIEVDGFTSNGSLYKTSPLKPTARPVLLGTIPGKPSEPIAWTHTYGPNNARVFYTSLGHLDDFANPQFRRLLLNSILWTLDHPIPSDNRLQPH